MSKKTAAPVGVAIKTSEAPPEEKAPKPKPKPKAKPKPTTGTIEIPIVEPAGGYCPSSVKTKLTNRQGRALKMLHTELYCKAECGVNGLSKTKPVDGFDNVVRWMLDQVANSWEEATGKKLEEVEGISFR